MEHRSEDRKADRSEAGSASSAQSESASPPGQQALDHLKLRRDGRGVVRTFHEWTRDLVDTYYPRIGQQSYRVPSLQFNPQFFEDDVRLGDGKQRKEPTPSDKVGRQAPTTILRELENLGKQLQAEGNPLFIISPFDFNGYLARAKPELRGGPVPPRPVNRREVDVVILSQQSGVILLEVKATGHSGFDYDDQDIFDKVTSSVGQLNRQLHEFVHIMPDLDHDLVTRAVAFPNLPQQRLDQVLGTDHMYQDITFLCQDDICQQHSTDTNTGHTNLSSLPSLYPWWVRCFGHPKTTQRKMPLEIMKTVVGRVLGVLSVVPVWTISKPRLEVRTSGQAVSLCGDLLSSRVVLTPQQVHLLSLPDHPQEEGWRVCVTGCMGSGKTLMLQLKGRQWAGEGRTVVILNLRTTATGRAAGHALAQAVSAQGGKVIKYDNLVDKIDYETLKKDLAESLESACFILDELSTRHVAKVIPKLKEHFPQSRIWYATLAVAQIPEGFSVRILTQCLRCPPSVQLLLKMLDRNPLYKDAYCTQSAESGLPCDGRPILFIRHDRHSRSNVRPQNCTECAEDLFRFMEEELGIDFSGNTGSKVSKKQKLWRKAVEKVEPDPVSFRDILILLSLPVSSYTPISGGLFKTTTYHVLSFLAFMAGCTFLSTLKSKGVPMRYVVDATSVEIVRPKKDEVVVTDILAVPSLERKVVVFLPGGPPLTDEEADHSALTRLFYPEGADVSSGSEQKGEDSSQKDITGQQKTGPHATGSQKTGSKEDVSQQTGSQKADLQVTSQSGAGASGTMAESTLEGVGQMPSYSSEEAMQLLESVLQNPKEVTLRSEELRAAFHRVLGNTMKPQQEEKEEAYSSKLSDVLTLDTGTQVQVGQERAEETAGAQLERPRMGAEMRGDAPNLQPVLRALREGVAKQRNPSPPSRPTTSTISPDSLFPLTDVRGNDETGPQGSAGPGKSERSGGSEGSGRSEVSGRSEGSGRSEISEGSGELGNAWQEEEREAREAVLSLSDDDQDSLFLAASRCLSQLVVTVPCPSTRKPKKAVFLTDSRLAQQALTSGQPDNTLKG